MSYDQVHDQLYIGDIESAREDSTENFDAVITVCQDSVEDNMTDDIEYYHFNMSDGPNGQNRGSHDYDIFKEAADTILEHLEAGDTVLVHCHLGQSRSSSTSIAALSVYEGMNYYDMESTVMSHRPQINPEQTLQEHAMQYIEEVGGFDPSTPVFDQG